MKYRPIIVDSSLQELTQHGTPEFPVSMDYMIVSDKDCANIRHWHDEIQVAVIIKGKVIFRTDNSEVVLEQGEGVFLNRHVLHEAIPFGSEESEYICVNFRPEILYHRINSLINRDYVETLISNEDLEIIALRNELWQQEICNLVTHLGEIYDTSPYCYEMKVVSILSQIWFLIVSNHREMLEKFTQVSFSDKFRIRILQDYIHQNYMDEISLGAIAEAAHISRGECCRIFKRVCNMTPFQYLIRHRIDQSIKLLRNSQYSIADIAGMVGFGSSSYFIQCFKREMTQTPLEYRMQYSN